MPDKKRRSKGLVPLTFFGVLFALGGIVAVTHPVGFASPGGVGGPVQRQVTTIYSQSDSVGFGVLFLVMSGILFAVALRIAKDG